MYIPKYFEETDISGLHGLMRSYPLGAWIVQADGELLANHLPFLIDPNRGAYGTLICHVARANPVWHACAKAANSLVIFQGPQTYITPSWYSSKHEHGKAVPTWNYAVVHAHGTPRIIEDRDWLLRHINELTDTHEAQRKSPWTVADAPEDYVQRMLDAIVGIEIPIDKLDGKWKVSQNRSASDKLGVIAGLLEQKNSQSQEMCALVSAHLAAMKGI